MEIDIDIKDYRVYIKKLYVDGLIEKKRNLKIFKKALEYSKEHETIDICWKSYTQLVIVILIKRITYMQ